MSAGPLVLFPRRRQHLLTAGLPGQLQTRLEEEVGTEVEAAALVLYPFLAAPGCPRAKRFTSKPGSLRARETLWVTMVSRRSPGCGGK